MRELFTTARFWQGLHGWLSVVWVAQFPLVFLILRDLQSSVPYLVGISIAAAALGEISAWHAVRVEVKLDEPD